MYKSILYSFGKIDIIFGELDLNFVKLTYNLYKFDLPCPIFAFTKNDNEEAHVSVGVNVKIFSFHTIYLP